MTQTSSQLSPFRRFQEKKTPCHSMFAGQVIHQQRTLGNHGRTWCMSRNCTCISGPSVKKIWYHSTPKSFVLTLQINFFFFFFLPSKYFSCFPHRIHLKTKREGVLKFKCSNKFSHENFKSKERQCHHNQKGFSAFQLAVVCPSVVCPSVQLSERKLCQRFSAHRQ